MANPQDIFRRAINDYNAQKQTDCVTEIVHKIVDDAIDGDAAAQKLVLEYVAPKIKPMTLQDVRAINGNTPSEKIDHIFNMLARGDMSVEQAMPLIDILKVSLDVKQLDVVRHNLEQLERNLGMSERTRKMVYG